MGAMPTRGVSAWDTLRSYLPNGHDLFKVAVAILILVVFYLLARLVRLLAGKELRRVKADPQVALLVNRIVFLTALFDWATKSRSTTIPASSRTSRCGRPPCARVRGSR